jgi:hypothetical protein
MIFNQLIEAFNNGGTLIGGGLAPYLIGKIRFNNS